MPVVQLHHFEPRATDALTRIALAANSLAALVADAHAISGALIEGEPQLVRDLEFLAGELETFELMSRTRLVMKNASGQSIDIRGNLRKRHEQTD